MTAFSPNGKITLRIHTKAMIAVAIALATLPFFIYSLFSNVKLLLYGTIAIFAVLNLYYFQLRCPKCGTLIWTRKIHICGVDIPINRPFWNWSKCSSCGTRL
jgi:hypothetical protein